jgi:CBS domain containing-hemolysin-like protein
MAREVMIHIHRTVACPFDMPVARIAEQALTADVRFVPIYRHRLDNLLGFVDVEALVTAPSLELNDLLQEPVFYPDTKSILNLFVEMSGRGLPVVFLSNEYGRVSGVITPHEIVAEIVGTRPGSRGADRNEIERQEDGSFLVAGVADVEDFRHLTGISLKSGPYDTVGGFILTELGRIPVVGEVLNTPGADFEIVGCDDVHIKEIRVAPRAAHRHA